MREVINELNLVDGDLLQYNFSFFDLLLPASHSPFFCFLPLLSYQEMYCMFEHFRHFRTWQKWLVS